MVHDVPTVLPDESRDKLSSVAFWIKDEELFPLARELKSQPKLHSTPYHRGERTEYSRIADVDDPVLAIARCRGPGPRSPSGHQPNSPPYSSSSRKKPASLIEPSATVLRLPAQQEQLRL